MPSPDPSLLTDLPTDWLQALEEAAVLGDDRAIVELTTHLSLKFASVGFYLTELANQFEFEQIVQFLHSRYSP